MKIIISRGVDRFFAKILVFRNEREVVACHPQKDFCELDAHEGDRIVVKLKYLDTSTVTIASFVYHTGNDVFYVSPTLAGRICELLTYAILPYFSLFFIALRAAIKSDAYGWFCTAFVVLTALSLVCYKVYPLIPSLRKRLLKTEVL